MSAQQERRRHPRGRGWPLLIAANTLPVRRRRDGGETRWEPAPGGLASALTPVARDAHGAWIGWTGAAGQAPRSFAHGGVRMLSVPLSRQEIAAYYEGFCNGTVWPLFHGAIREPTYNRPWWAAYVAVNERFAAHAAEHAAHGATVWVQDYHLMLMPALLRRRRPDVRIGFFLHIPFPAEDLFARLPWRAHVVTGLLGADVIGFQTPVAARNFQRLARRFAGAEVHGNTVRVGEHEALVDAFPISIDLGRFERETATEAARARVDDLRRRVARGRRVLLGVDRLDYTKGIDLRLQAYADLLTRRPELAAEIVLVQVAVPSRDRVEQYRRLQERVDAIVGRLNGELGGVSVQPVNYVRRNLDFEELVAMYQLADVMLVTPLADGMNLVAKEYVAARTEDRGVLVLSEFAGAAAEFSSALLVNPHDVDGMAETIERALAMAPTEQRRRMRALRAAVRANTVQDWAANFLETLRSVGR
jgi:trehalose 6-phosphate synthase